MFGWLNKKPHQEVIPPSNGFFSTDLQYRPRKKIIAAAINTIFQRTAEAHVYEDSGFALDSSSISQVKRLNSNFGLNVPDAQLGWYASQGFIGYQTCAILAQHWLVDKALTMPARDAVRNWFELAVNDGTKVKPEVFDYIKKRDKAFRLKKHSTEFVRKGRMFGIRIAMFKVDSPDPDYYTNPFNIDGVKKGSYKGIVQVDPYWITPELSQESAIDPASPEFYEPTWWRINGKRYHKSHLVIMTTGEVADILKPTYMYGGVSIPQKIFERVYAAERTANESPMLAMTKRLITLKADMQAALADQPAFEAKMQTWLTFMNNFGVKVIGGEEEIEQFDTSLADVDDVTMTQYQLVSAASEVPSTKLMGTTPKGFNSSGSYEESSYHEFLESLQEHDVTPLVERHYQLLMRSEIAPKFGTEFEITVNWNPVVSLSATEIADNNLKKAQTDSALSAAGAIDGQDVRKRIINDKESGYNGIAEVPESGWHDDEEENDDDPEGGGKGE